MKIETRYDLHSVAAKRMETETRYDLLLFAAVGVETRANPGQGHGADELRVGQPLPGPLQGLQHGPPLGPFHLQLPQHPPVGRRLPATPAPRGGGGSGLALRRSSGVRCRFLCTCCSEGTT